MARDQQPAAGKVSREARSAVEDALARLSAGSLTDDDKLFVRELSRCLLAASVGASSKSLAGDVLKASGLGGQRVDRDERDFIEAVLRLQGFDGWSLTAEVEQHIHLLPEFVDDDPDKPMTVKKARRLIETELERRRAAAPPPITDADREQSGLFD